MNTVQVNGADPELRRDGHGASPIATHLGLEQQSRDWPYPEDLEGFLEAVRADPDDDDDTGMRVVMFMLTPVARRMPMGL